MKDGLLAREVAEILGVTARHVALLYRQGKFPHAGRVGDFGIRSPLLIPRGDVDAYLAERNKKRRQSETDDA